MADILPIDDEPRRQRDARKQALATLTNFSVGGYRPLASVDDLSMLFGSINATASVLAVAVAGDDGLNDQCTAQVIEGIALLAALGDFAAGSR